MSGIQKASSAVYRSGPLVFSRPRAPYTAEQKRSADKLATMVLRKIHKTAALLSKNNFFYWSIRNEFGKPIHSPEDLKKLDAVLERLVTDKQYAGICKTYPGPFHISRFQKLERTIEANRDRAEVDKDSLHPVVENSLELLEKENIQLPKELKQQFLRSPGRAKPFARAIIFLKKNGFQVDKILSRLNQSPIFAMELPRFVSSLREVNILTVQTLDDILFQDSDFYPLLTKCFVLLKKLNLFTPQNYKKFIHFADYLTPLSFALQRAQDNKGVLTQREFDRITMIYESYIRLENADIEITADIKAAFEKDPLHGKLCTRIFLKLKGVNLLTDKVIKLLIASKDFSLAFAQMLNKLLEKKLFSIDLLKVIVKNVAFATILANEISRLEESDTLGEEILRVFLLLEGANLLTKANLEKLVVQEKEVIDLVLKDLISLKSKGGLTQEAFENCIDTHDLYYEYEDAMFRAVDSE